MKYILEIKPEYEDKFRGVMILGAENSNLYVDSQAAEELEELNSDYINEHFGDLQDTAYQKGFEDGKKEAESSEAIEQAKADAFNKGMLFKEEKIHDAYQRGLEDGKAVNDKGCEGCKYANVAGTHEPCVRCSNCYSNQWAAKADKIEVGDEVEWDNDFTGDRFIVTRIYQPYGKKEQCDGIDDDGDVYRAVLIESLVKTGRHFDIASILEAMKHD